MNQKKSIGDRLQILATPSNKQSLLCKLVSGISLFVISLPISASAQSLYSTYYTATGKFTIEKIAEDATISTYATAPSGNLGFVGSLAFDATGNLYVVDNGRSGRIVDKIDLNGNVSTYATTPPDNGGFFGSLAFDATGNLYATDQDATGRNIIDKIDANGNISTYATTPLGNGGFINGLVFDSSSNLYSIDYNTPYSNPNGQRIVDKIAPNGTISTYATTPTGNGGFVDGLVFDATGNLYVVDNNRSGQRIVDKIAPDGSVTTYATTPTGTRSFFGDLAFDATGNLYVTGSDSLRQTTIEKIATNGNVSTYITSSVSSGYFFNGLAFSPSAFTSTAVPEPFTIIGTLIGGTAALRMRKKLKSTAKS